MFLLQNYYDFLNLNILMFTVHTANDESMLIKFRMRISVN